MSQRTDNALERLGYLIDLLGPEQTAALTRGLTDDELTKVDAFFANAAPATRLTWLALDVNGKVRDPQAYAELLKLVDAES